jgi:nitroreductase
MDVPDGEFPLDPARTELAHVCHRCRVSDDARTPADVVRPLLRVRQIREFEPGPPSDEQLAAIADAARWSGSSTNSQPWRFIVIRDREALRRIHDAGLPQTRSLATAPAAIAIVLPDGQDPISHAYDEGRAAERMLIAASFLGLGAGIAWVMPHVRRLVAELLDLPGDRFVRTIVVVGRPTDRALAPKNPPGKARLPREHVVFEGRWPKR